MHRYHRAGHVMRLIVLIFLSGCAGNFVEYKHLSTYPSGSPFNGDEETSADTVFVGHRHRVDNGVYASGAAGYRLRDSNYRGGEPTAEFVLGYEKQ